MNTSRIISAAVFAVTLGTYGAAKAESLTIVIHDIRHESGTIRVEALAGQAQFEGKGAAVKFQQTAVKGSMTLVVGNLTPSEYAIRIVHDVNDNSELDANLIGIPTEPYAFSNNARGNFGPPKWEDVHFMLEGDVTQNIHLVY